MAFFVFELLSVEPSVELFSVPLIRGHEKFIPAQIITNTVQWTIGVGMISNFQAVNNVTVSIAANQQKFSWFIVKSFYTKRGFSNRLRFWLAFQFSIYFLLNCFWFRFLSSGARKNSLQQKLLCTVRRLNGKATSFLSFS